MSPVLNKLTMVESIVWNVAFAFATNTSGSQITPGLHLLCSYQNKEKTDPIYLIR